MTGKIKTFVEDLHWTWKHLGVLVLAGAAGGVAWAQLNDQVNDNTAAISDGRKAITELREEEKEQGRKIERIDERTILILREQQQINRTLQRFFAPPRPN